MKFELLKPNTLNNWFGLVFLVCNSIILEFTILGYGFRFDWLIKDPVGDYIEEIAGEVDE